jgi:hypothetical protein
MKKLNILIATAALPFLLVWAAFVLTAFNFNPREVFNSGSFWGPSVLYWLLWVCLSPLIIEMIDEQEAEQKTTLSKEEMIQKHLNAEPTRQNPEYEAFVRNAMNKLK